VTAKNSECEFHLKLWLIPYLNIFGEDSNGNCWKAKKNGRLKFFFRDFPYCPMERREFQV
jgi:hypothetical protein